ncbi:S9 family peptidase [Glaciecola sp. MH2013]|uniref:alpha/beta hydrolase family protein n=1 Tax=Glaciecola sp. MH2013 TaxID=2785524 RepID=UPI001E5B3A27|nr:prolyl oligopeptidase family serine peptidase [Glaciecola sp. MH2013]
MSAQAEEYKAPPKMMADLVDAPRQPGTAVSRNNQYIAFLKRPGAQSIVELAQPEETLAGLRINPANFAPARSTGFTAIEIRSMDSNKTSKIENLPEGKIMTVRFSPDSKNLAFLLEQPDSLTLWNYELASKELKQVSDKAINASLGGARYRWKGDSSGFITRLTVASASDAPKQAAAAPLPIVQTSDGKKAAVRTYSNLLKTPHDEALFEFLTTSQLASIDLNGKVSKIGEPGIIRGYSYSPNRNFLLVSQLKKPFSYLVPASRFPLLTQVWTTDGKLVETIADLPSGESIPKGFDSTLEGRRSISWRSDMPQTLMWAEAQDGGNMSNDVEFHDAVYTWEVGAGEPAKKLLDIERRFAGIEWGDDDFAMVSDWRFSDRKLRTWKFNPSDLSEEKVLFQERSYNDRYNDPGDFVYELNGLGQYVIKEDDGKVLLTGRGASPKGNIPFMDAYDFNTQSKTRLWASEAPYYERIIMPLSDDANKVLTVRESQTEQPNFFIRDIKKNSLKQMTDFPHPSPAFVGVTKEKIEYTRADGVALSGTLYLPPGYDKSKGPLPVLMWAYPLEYKDAAVASQVTESPYEFVRVSYWGPMPHLAQGFAVFDDPKMPIIGSGDNLPNDSFREQLVSSAQAAVDVLVERGVADKDRIAIAGHSYGAFMVANLLAHSDIFKAGIARSGAYNRTLTPFGFQGEERSFWEGQPVYASMSPFFHAEKIDEPMLMIHGKDDPNSGTFPMQSERMFAALKGLGATARLVMLPHEQHGYRARESLLHMMWEQYEWLDTYVLESDKK